MRLSYGITSVILLIGTLLLSISFQNCSGGFQGVGVNPNQAVSAEMSSLSSTQTFSTGTNRLGIGVAYAVDAYPSESARALAREQQLQLASQLVGSKGFARIWCYLGEIWSAPQGNGPAECLRAIGRSFELDLIPVIVLNDIPGPDDTSIDLKVGARDFTSAAKKVLSLAKSITVPAGRQLWIELANEPNATDWWPSGTCNATIRAREVARQSTQIAKALRGATLPGIKILSPSLMAYSDYDLPPDKNGTCKGRRGVLGIPSYDFVGEMRRESPEFFSTPLFDAWNAHAYPSSHYGVCQGGSCPSVAQDFALVDYRRALQAGGLPASFPVIITEAGHRNSEGPNKQIAADYFVHLSSQGQWEGVLPEIWMRDKNVLGVIGFVLKRPKDSFSWVSAETGVANPIYTQVLSYRLSGGEGSSGGSSTAIPSASETSNSASTAPATAPAPVVSSPKLRMKEGYHCFSKEGCIYANGQGRYCLFTSWDLFKLRSGNKFTADYGMLSSYSDVSDGICN